MRRVELSEKILNDLVEENKHLRETLRKSNPFILSDEHEEKWICIHCGNRKREGHLSNCEYIKLCGGV